MPRAPSRMNLDLCPPVTTHATKAANDTTDERARREYYEEEMGTLCKMHETISLQVLSFIRKYYNHTKIDEWGAPRPPWSSPDRQGAAAHSPHNARAQKIHALPSLSSFILLISFSNASSRPVPVLADTAATWIQLSLKLEISRDSTT